MTGISDAAVGTIVGIYGVGGSDERAALRLEASAAKLSLPLVLEPVLPRPDGQADVRQKPHVLKRIRERLRGPLLFVECDAVLHASPWPHLAGSGGDVSAAQPAPGGIADDILLLADTPGATRFLEAWIAEQVRDPALAGQQAIARAVARSAQPDSALPVDLRYLPPGLARLRNAAAPSSMPPIEFVGRAGTAEDAAGAAATAARLWRIAAIEESLGLLSDDDAEMGAAPPAAFAYAEQPAALRTAHTAALMSSGATDVARWAAGPNLKSNWSERAAMAALIVGASSPVIDLGCGNMDVAAFLPAETIYLPADIVRRDSRTLHCDLNGNVFPSRHAETALMLGVLEYVHDVALLFERLAGRWRRIVMSYNPADLDRGRDRRAHGWFNDLTSAELVSLAAAAGYGLHLHCALDHRQRFYDFRLT